MNNNIIKNTLYIIRHGETEGNIQGILQGQHDTPLTQKGIDEATQNASIFNDITFDSIYCSDLERCCHTSKLLFGNRNIPITKNPLLRERNFGTYNGKHVQNYFDDQKENIKLRNSLTYEKRFSFKITDDIESDQELLHRFLTFCKEIKDTHHSTSAIVTHGGFMRALLIYFGFATYSELPPESIKNLGYFILETDGDSFIVKATYNIEKQ